MSNGNIGEQSNKVEQEISEVAEDLQISLPHVNLPWPVKLIALFTLVGGLSITASAFADIFSPVKVNFVFYLLRIFTGLAFIFITYGIIKRRRWSLWLYGLLVVVGFFSNPFLALFPAFIVVYLYTQRRYFVPSVFDRRVQNIQRYVVKDIMARLRRPRQ